MIKIVADQINKKQLSKNKRHSNSNSLFYQTIFCSFVYLTKNCLRKVLDFILSKLDRRPISCYFRVIASFEGSWDGCSSQVGNKKSKYLADVPNKSKVDQQSFVCCCSKF